MQQEKKIDVDYELSRNGCPLSAIGLAKGNGLILLTIPPKTSHKLQPLDVSSYVVTNLSIQHIVAQWMIGCALTQENILQYDLSELVSHAVSCLWENLVQFMKKYKKSTKFFGNIKLTLRKL